MSFTNAEYVLQTLVQNEIGKQKRKVFSEKRTETKC